MSELCSIHKLVAAPDGRCVVCRRPKLSLLTTGEDESVASKAVTAVLGLGLLGAMAALAYMAMLPTANASRSRSIASASLVTQMSAAKDKTTHKTTHKTAAERAQAAASSPDALESSSDATRDDAVATHKTSSTPSVKASTQPPAETKKRPRTVGERIVDPRLIAARREVSVTMYSAPWCYICDRARRFLEAREVDLIEYDVDMEPTASKQLAQLNPAASIPTFVVDGKTIVGFHPWGLEDAIDQVAQQRFCEADGPQRKDAPGAVCERLASAR